MKYASLRNNHHKTRAAQRGEVQWESSERKPIALHGWLSRGLAHQVERYAETTDTSVSKAIATLVRLGIESQAGRKREFFKKLKANLANDDPRQQERLVDEFRTLILGR